MKDACFIRRTNIFAQMKLSTALIIQIQVVILVSGDYVDFMTDSNDSQVAATRVKRAQSARPTRTCTQPPVTPDKNYFVRVSPKEELTDAKPGETVPENAIIISQCNRGYVLDYESEESHETASICKSNSWLPPILKCKRICMNFSNFLNFNMTCYQYSGGPKIPCDGLLLEGAVVKPRCQRKFRPDKNVDYDFATCREDGNWDKEFFSCIPACGAVASSSVSLIADGQFEKRGGAPWNLVIYSIQRNPEIPEFICGGTLITAELALSAAHCFYSEIFHQKLDIGFFYASVAKATPDFNRTDYPAITKTYRLKNIYFPDVITYEGALTNYAGDIVILQLSEKVTFSPDVFPACLHWDVTEHFHPGENVTGKLSGFGATADESFPSALLSANLPYISYGECKKRVRNDFRTSISTDKFCAGSEKGTGARKGDSGGGILFMDDATGLYHLRGVVSTRDLSDSSIATFTDVAQYMPWIVKTRKAIENESKSCRCSLDGSLRTSCDSKTKNCQCKAFVTGTNCDTCKDGYWKLRADNSNGCVACGCSSSGSHSSTCDKITGSCQCKPSIIGRRCDQCADNRKVLASNGCEEPCKCHPDGSLSSSCDSKTKKCQCKKFVTGTNCDTCRDNYWKLQAHNPDGCTGCECSSIGSYSSTCDKINGSCQCKPGVVGKQCDVCADDRGMFGSNGCESKIAAELKWVKFSAGKTCSNAVRLHDATDRSDTSIIARHQSTHKLASIPRSESNSQFSEYEVLCGDSVKWVKESGPVPHGAVVTHWDEVDGPYSGAYYICQTIVYPGTTGFGEVHPDGICITSGDISPVHGPRSYGYMAPKNAKDGVKWVKFSRGDKCSNAVVLSTNNYLGEQLLVLRLQINATSGSGKTESTYKVQFLLWNVEKKYFFTSGEKAPNLTAGYEVLCGDVEEWTYPSLREPFAPLGAVVHRKEEAARYKGKYYESIFDTYYICRALADDGSMVLGERLDRVEPCIISYGGRQIRRFANQYDILVQYNATG